MLSSATGAGWFAGTDSEAAAAVMAAGFLITRLTLVCLLSELDYSSAFPKGRGNVYPEAWQSLRSKQAGYGYGNRRPLQYIQALRQADSKLQPDVHDQVQVRTWQKPQESSLNVRSHAPLQYQPIHYHQNQHQQWSPVATKWTHEMPPSQHPPQRNHPLSTPITLELSLNVPFAEELDQNKETTGRRDVADQYSHLYRPTSVHIYSAFNSPPGPEGFSGKDSTNYPAGGNTAHEVTKPRFQLSLSVPIPPTTQSQKPSRSNGGHLANLQNPGRVGFDQNSYVELVAPQSSSTQIASERGFLHPAGTAQLQPQHQTYQPIQPKHTDNKIISFSPVHASQYKTPTEQISQAQIPTKQSLVYPQHPVPSLPIPQYPPLQPADVYSGYYSTHINPLSNGNRKCQSGRPVSPAKTNVHHSLMPPQYEQVQSGHYSAGQIKPSAINYGQQQQHWQPAGAPLTFAFEQSVVQVKPSFGQNVETLPDLRPGHASYPTAAPSQYVLPSFHQVATPNDYGIDNLAQMGSTNLSSPYQYNRDMSGQDASPGHQTAVDPSSNLQRLSTDYQTQMRLPTQHTGREQVDRKPQYAKLYIDDTDVTDIQPNYSAAPPAHYDGFTGTY